MAKVTTSHRVTNKKKFLGYLVVFAIVVVIVSIGSEQLGSTSPKGKSWMSQDGWTEYSFGDTYGKDDNFLNYNHQIFDAYGSPIRHIHREGTFTIDGNIINSKFNDGEPPYKLEYKKVDGEWSVLDENGNVFIWDDPVKRK